MDEINKLEAEILRHDKLYADGVPEISDFEYDTKRTRLEKIHPHSNVLKRTGAHIPSYGKTVKHQLPMGSINKCHSFQEFCKWLKHSQKVVWSWKVDGYAVSIRYRNHKLFKGCSRGDGYVGMDITDHLRNCPLIPQEIYDKSLPGDFEVRGDAYIKRDYFKEHIVPLYGGANERNSVAGFLNSKTPLDCADKGIRIKCYRFIPSEKTLFSEYKTLEKYGFEVCKQHKQELTADLLDELAVKREKLSFRTDGLVIAINNNLEREFSGYNGLNCKGVIAYKFPPVVKSTVFTKDTVTIGRTGKVTPMAVLEPIEIDGSVVSSASLHNYGYVERLNLKYGDYVFVEKRGDIIPQVSGVKIPAGKIPVEIPTKCPYCNKKLEENGANLYCINNDCPERMNNLLEYMFKVCDIKEVGYSTIHSFIENGLIKNIVDIFFITKNQILSLRGFKEAKADTIFKAIDGLRTMKLEQFICALGIDGVGKEISKNIAREIKYIGEFIDLRETIYSRVIPLVGDTTKDNVKEFIDRNYDNIFNIMAVIKVLPFGYNPDRKETSITGKTFCCTGGISIPRKEIQDILEINGAEYINIKSGLDYLIIGTGAVDVKIEKAKKLGATILTEQQFHKLIRG